MICSRRLLALVYCALPLVSCDGGPASTGFVEQEIIGGVVDPNDPAVMLLFAQKPNSNQGFLCSATLVAPSVLLTAAHCVSPQTVGQGASIRIFAGTDWSKPGQNAWSEAKEVHYDLKFDINNLSGGHDIAVAILPQPSNVTPVKLNRTPIAKGHVGKPVRIVGYGVDDGQKLSGVGVKRTANTVLDDFSAALLHIGDSKHQSCEGDSGGPAFMNLGGSEELVGVTSYGQAGCLGGAWDTRVDIFAAFIDQFTAAPPRPDPPAPPQPKPMPKQLGKKS